MKVRAGVLRQRLKEFITGGNWLGLTNSQHEQTANWGNYILDARSTRRAAMQWSNEAGKLVRSAR